MSLALNWHNGTNDPGLGDQPEAPKQETHEKFPRLDLLKVRRRRWL